MVALLMTASLLSLAGGPLTAGFIGKFYVVASGIEAGLWLPLGALVLGSAVSIFYYLRVIYALSVNTEEVPSSIAGQPLLTAAFIGLLVAVFALGVYPQPLIQLVAGVL